MYTHLPGKPNQRYRYELRVLGDLDQNVIPSLLHALFNQNPDVVDSVQTGTLEIPFLR